MSRQLVRESAGGLWQVESGNTVWQAGAEEDVCSATDDGNGTHWQYSLSARPTSLYTDAINSL